MEKKSFVQRCRDWYRNHSRVCRVFRPYGNAVAVVFVLVSVFQYMVPLEITSVSAYAGITLFLAGLLSLIYPLRWVGISTRKLGSLVLLGGMAVFLVALQWPAPVIGVSERKSAIDDLLPEYHFHERHEVRVRATPEITASVFKRITFDEIGVYHTLMRLRALASGKWYQSNTTQGKPILETMTGPNSIFAVVEENDRQIVFVGAGRPWTKSNLPRLKDRQEFENYRLPSAVRIAADLRVEDAGAGETLVVTETRVQATDEEGARIMARYWRLIYPGSGLIRRMWLHSIRDRAERQQKEKNQPEVPTTSECVSSVRGRSGWHP